MTVAPERSYKVLILTDHRIHSQVESIYSIGKTLARSVSCEKVFAASRGVPENDLFFADPKSGKIRGRVVDETFAHSEDGKFWHSGHIEEEVRKFDVVMLRLPISSSIQFFDAIARVIPRHRMINQPQGIMETGSKQFLLNFPDLCPPMAFCKTVEQVDAFRKQFPIVLKPLRNSGGKGMVRIEGNEVEGGGQKLQWREYLPILRHNLAEGVLAMKFLENVALGDKRTILVNGQNVASAIRYPAEGNWLCNISMGGTSALAEPDEQEMEIARTLGPILLRKGVVLFGFDTLVGDDGRRMLSEINSSCVNGIYPAELHSGKPIIQNSVDLIWRYIHGHIEPQNSRL